MNERLKRTANILLLLSVPTLLVIFWVYAYSISMLLGHLEAIGLGTLIFLAAAFPSLLGITAAGLIHRNHRLSEQLAIASLGVWCLLASWSGIETTYAVVSGSTEISLSAVGLKEASQWLLNVAIALWCTVEGVRIYRQRWWRSDTPNDVT